MRAKTVRKKLAVLWVLGLVIVAGVGFTVWYAYHSSQAADTALKSANKVSNDIPRLPQVKTYADCQKSPGSKTLLTYPAQCVTTGGKTFTDNSQKYLVIKEWSVKMPLSADMTDATYLITANVPDAAYLSLEKLTNTGCSASAGTLGVIDRFAKGAVDTNNGRSMLSEFPDATPVGNYYYIYHAPQAYCDPGKVQLPAGTNYHQLFAQAVKQMQAN